MKTITAILVDDEISNLKGLQQKLEKLFPQIKILNTFQKPEEAIKVINNTPPDILFLDIEMPRINGFELLSRLIDVDFQVIFVTAYSEYAIEAFKKNVIDYILKPIDDENLIIGVNKALKIIKKENLTENNVKLIQLLTEQIKGNNKIIVPTIKGISFFPEEDVVRLEGFEGYTKVYLKNNDIVTSSYSIGKYEKQLQKMNFYQCHRSHLINIKYISEFLNEGFVVLEDNHKVPVSKVKRKHFLNMNFE
ncbi:MAG: LytTR family DNA-binding domain-containing protein [Cellulophaga sp.]